MQTTSTGIYPPEITRNRNFWLAEQWKKSKGLWETAIFTLCIGVFISITAMIIVKPDEYIKDTPPSMYRIGGISCNMDNAGARITKDGTQKDYDYVCLKNKSTWLWIRQPM